MTEFAIQSLPPVMTTEEVAGLLRCSLTTVDRYVFSHQLAAIRIGRQRRFRAEDVLEFVGTRPTTAKCGKRQLRRRVPEGHSPSAKTPVSRD